MESVNKRQMMKEDNNEKLYQSVEMNGDMGNSEGNNV